MIPALVLTAGLATRLRPLSLVRAKGAVPVAGLTITERILRSLAAAGVRDAVLNLHHLPDTLTRRIGDGTGLGLRVRYSWESPVLGSAGGPRRALPLLGSRRFLIVNGDVLTNLDFSALIADHDGSGALATLAVVPNTEPDKYDGLAVDAAGNVTGRVMRGTGQPSFHFVGPQVVECDAFASVPPDVPYETVATLYPALIARRPGAVRAFRCDAEYHDIGTPADYLATSLLIGEREGVALDVGRHCRISPAARLQRSVLWDDVVVEDGVLLRETIVTDRVRVPADTAWHGVVLRLATGELAAGEKQIGDLAVCNI
ncbi:MAG TPA: NDP-sugar synthase [Vicinamibacterales bacterium]|nr:NDP-sugar synthase [Vicinamibacterales bacterium]